MIFVCDIVSNIPEYKDILVKYFGDDYKDTISNSEIKTLIIDSNHRSSISPIYLMFREIGHREHELYEKNKQN